MILFLIGQKVHNFVDPQALFPETTNRYPLQKNAINSLRALEAGSKSRIFSSKLNPKQKVLRRTYSKSLFLAMTVAKLFTKSEQGYRVLYEALLDKISPGNSICFLSTLSVYTVKPVPPNRKHNPWLNASNVHISRILVSLISPGAVVSWTITFRIPQLLCRKNIFSCKVQKIVIT